MISYMFDINILSKIKICMSQNVVLFLQNGKKTAKKPLALSKILLYFEYQID